MTTATDYLHYFTTGINFIMGYVETERFALSATGRAL